MNDTSHRPGHLLGEGAHCPLALNLDPLGRGKALLFHAVGLLAGACGSIAILADVGYLAVAAIQNLFVDHVAGVTPQPMDRIFRNTDKLDSSKGLTLNTCQLATQALALHQHPHIQLFTLHRFYVALGCLVSHRTATAQLGLGLAEQLGLALFLFWVCGLLVKVAFRVL